MQPFKIEHSLGYMINRTAARMRQELQRQFAAQGHEITLAQWTILNRLWEEEGLTQNDLAERTFREKTSIARTLALLEEQNLITRQRAEHDRRNYRVMLTPQGRALKDQLIPLAIAALNQACRSLSAEQVAMLMATLTTICTNLEQGQSEPLPLEDC